MCISPLFSDLTLPNNNLPSSRLLGSYLAGLIEGDGSIVVPKTARNQKGKLHMKCFYTYRIYPYIYVKIRMVAISHFLDVCPS